VAAALAGYLAEDRVTFLAAVLSGHNAIERVWQDLHANVTRNHRCPDMVA